MRLARALVGFAAGLLLSTSAVFVASGWQAGLGCLTAAAACAVLGWDIDRVMRESRWQVADRQRAAQALREASNRDYGFRIDDPAVRAATWYSVRVDGC